jgi:2-methylcitrate dehydratase PrpD
VSAGDAAFLNGVAVHALDFDLSYAMGRVAAPVFPALLAVCEEVDASGGDLLEAYAWGFDVAAKMARSEPAHSSAGGWHASGTVGAVAACAALVRLLRLTDRSLLSKAQARAALALAASMGAGLTANFGTFAKPLHAGNAARNSVFAIQLASAGATGSENALDGDGGFLAAHAGGRTVDLSPFEELGVSFDLCEVGAKLKRWPCGGLSHGAIDAALALRDRLGDRLWDTESVCVGLTDQALRRLLLRMPETLDEARFSIPYLVLHAIRRGEPGLDAFNEQTVRQLAHDPLIERIIARCDEEFAHCVIQSPARLTVRIANSGEEIEIVVQDAPGSPSRPVTPTWLRSKFMQCVTGVLGSARGGELLTLLGRTGSIENWRYAFGDIAYEHVPTRTGPPAKLFAYRRPEVRI